MLTNEKFENNGDTYKKKRSISTKLLSDLDEKNKPSKCIKSRHRKMASSYFLGSYISGNELNNFLQEYKGINNENSTNCNKNTISEIENDKDEFQHNLNNINKLKNSLINNQNELSTNRNNNTNLNEKNIALGNASFYSYSIEDEDKNENDKKNSFIIKGSGDESLTNNCETKSNSYINTNNNNNNFNNNPFYELEKNSEKNCKDKSFIQMKNVLKFIKDKEERVTESYLMALNGGESNHKNKKNQYLPTASIIEEEKSEFIESTSKKQSIINGAKFIKDINFKKKKIENEFNIAKNEDNILEKSSEEENKENIDLNIIQKNQNINYNAINNSIKKVINNILIRKNSNIENNINKIKIKKNNEEEKKRKCIRKNKDNLLNSFYNLSYNQKIIPYSNDNNKNININHHKKEGNGSCINILNCKDILSCTNKIIINNNFNNSNFHGKEKRKELIKSSSKSLIKMPSYLNKKKRNFSYSGGYISYLYHQRFNTENSMPKNNEKMKYNISKYIYRKSDKNIIYQIYNKNSHERVSKKKLNKSMNNQLLTGIKFNQKTKIKIPHKKVDKSLIKNKNNEIVNKNMQIIKNNLKKNENIILLDLSYRKAFSISKDKNGKEFVNKNILNLREVDSINYIKKVEPLLCCNIKTCLDTSRALNQRKNSKKTDKMPTYSDSHSSRIKQKVRDKIINNNNNNNNNNSRKKCLIRKANSGLFSSKLQSEIQNRNEFDINISNKKQTLIILKEKIKFLKAYEKIDVLEKITKTMNCNKSSFIILCENNNNNDFFVFNGLFKYYENQKRFIKIYGNEKVPNVILIRNINSSNYRIYENKIIQNEENKIQFFFDQIDSFYFSFNSIIICKK